MKNNQQCWKLVIFVVLLLACFSCSKENTPDTVEIPFTLENGRFIINATINGTQGKFAFDTGSPYSYFENVKKLPPIGFTLTNWVGHIEFGLKFRLSKIAFGDMEVKSKSAVINRRDIVMTMKNRGYDGLLGNMIFEGYWCEISYSKRKIILHKVKPDYFTHYSPVVISNKYDPHFYIPITVDGKNFYLTIDTALPFAIFFPGGIINGKNSNEYREIVSNEQVKQYYLVKTNAIHILDETYTDVSIMTNSYFAQGAIGKRLNTISFDDAALIGNTFLQYYDLLLDLRELRKGKTTGMYYEPNTPLVERNYGFFSFIESVPQFGVLNFAIHNESGAMMIRSILRDSIAYTVCGLRPGTIITKINGEPLNKYSREMLIEPSFYLTVDNFTVLEGDNERTIISPMKNKVYEIPTAD